MTMYPHADCSTCGWYVKIAGEAGVCYRYPPRDNHVGGRRPVVQPRDWCAEWVSYTDAKRLMESVLLDSEGI